jgi:hypothetical protein
VAVAIYVQGLEVVLVSESRRPQWYGYISKWQLDVDGTIGPRFGFSAVPKFFSLCVCIHSLTTMTLTGVLIPILELQIIIRYASLTTLHFLACIFGIIRIR